MFPITTVLPRPPTLAAVPGAVALAALTTEGRLAAVLTRSLPDFLPLVLHRHASAVLETLLFLELALLAVRLLLLAAEYLFVATACVDCTPFGASLLAARTTVALGGDLLETVAASAAPLGVAAIAVIWLMQVFGDRRNYRPKH